MGLAPKLQAPYGGGMVMGGAPPGGAPSPYPPCAFGAYPGMPGGQQQQQFRVFSWQQAPGGFGAPPQQDFLPPGGMAGAIHAKLAQIVAANQLQRFYLPQALQALQALAARLDARVNFRDLAAWLHMPVDLVLHLASQELYDIIFFADDSGSMACDEICERIDDLKLFGRTVAETATRFPTRLADDEDSLLHFMNSPPEGYRARSAADLGGALPGGAQYRGLALPLLTRIDVDNNGILQQLPDADGRHDPGVLRKLLGQHSQQLQAAGWHGQLMYGAQTDTCSLLAGCDETGARSSGGGGYDNTPATSGGTRSSGGGGYDNTPATSGGTRSSGGGGYDNTPATSGGARSSGGGGYDNTPATSGGTRSSGGGGYDNTPGTSGGARSSGGDGNPNMPATSGGSSGLLDIRTQALWLLAVVLGLLCLPTAQAQPVNGSAAAVDSAAAGPAADEVAAALIDLLKTVVQGALFMALVFIFWPALNAFLDRILGNWPAQQGYVPPGAPAGAGGANAVGAPAPAGRANALVGVVVQ